jgi:TRAP-type C4-dicarboxylate transport system permease large subunit
MNVYVVAGVVKDVPLPTIFKGVFPFVVAIFICILIVALFPQLSLWLPNLIFGPA